MWTAPFCAGECRGSIARFGLGETGNHSARQPAGISCGDPVQRSLVCLSNAAWSQKDLSRRRSSSGQSLQVFWPPREITWPEDLRWPRIEILRPFIGPGGSIKPDCGRPYTYWILCLWHAHCCRVGSSRRLSFREIFPIDQKHTSGVLRALLKDGRIDPAANDSFAIRRHWGCGWDEAPSSR